MIGFLNKFFPDWFTGPSAARLPFGYNALRIMRKLHIHGIAVTW
jgi:hypothetical protein